MPVDFAPVRFSTWDMPEQERLARWREQFARRMLSVEVEPLATDIPFHAQATLQSLPGLRTAMCSGSAARLNRTRALAADGDDSIGLMVNLGPRASMSQRGEQVTLQPGQAVLLLHEQPAALIQDDVGFLGRG